MEAERGHRFTAPPVVEGLPEREFLARMDSMRTSEPSGREAQGEVALRAVGALPPGTTLDEVVAEQLTAGVQGYYDPTSGELVVRGDVTTPFVQTVIAHELTHALDDQLFDLASAQAAAATSPEAVFGLLALMEGSARVVESAYADSLAPEEQVAVIYERLDLADLADPPGAGDPVLDDRLLALGLTFTLPYGNGEALVEAILSDGGTAALDAAFAAPPTTSEQVLDPEVYLAGEPAIPVEVPPAEGPVLDSGPFGAVDLRLLEAIVDPMEVLSAIDPEVLVKGATTFAPVDGFGGGSYVAWEDDRGRSCLRADLVGDDAAGATTMTRIVRSWAAAVGDVEVDATDATGLTFSTCR